VGSRAISVVVGAIVLLAAPCSVTSLELLAASQSQADRQARSSEPLVIQGRITAIEGTVVTVKLPNGFPAREGGHAQFVTAGPVFRVDMSHARVLLPDGKQNDKQPLAVGDYVVIVLTPPESGPGQPGTVGATYSASIVERVVQGNKVTSH